jgi:phosphoribosyl 1,2-cyclic phosphodiesterase
MSLFFASLNSGSNGNCYYVGNGSDAVLVDAGISCREVSKRMSRLGLDMSKLRAIFISHEHTDHTRGLALLSKKYKLPVYISKPTLQFSGLYLEKELIREMAVPSAVNIGDLTISCFVKHHDAADPASFLIRCNDTTVGVFTDIGKLCSEVKKQFEKCDAVFLESNYDAKMLEEGNYPRHLKHRIRSGKGHLSNAEALHLFNEHRSSQLSHLVLSHLSQNNNCPQLVEQLFAPHAGNTKVHIASRYEESPLFNVAAAKQAVLRQYIPAHAPQLELFAS